MCKHAIRRQGNITLCIIAVLLLLDAVSLYSVSN